MISTLKEIVSLAFVDALEELISNIVVVLDFLSTQQQMNVTGLIILMLVKIKAHKIIFLEEKKILHLLNKVFWQNSIIIEICFQF